MYNSCHKDLVDAMKMLGLNPMEQEVIDLTNNNVKNGYIYFPEFCNIIHKKYREENEEVFYQDMFKVKILLNLNIFTWNQTFRFCVAQIHGQ